MVCLSTKILVLAGQSMLLSLSTIFFPTTSFHEIKSVGHPLRSGRIGGTKHIETAQTAAHSQLPKRDFNCLLRNMIAVKERSVNGLLTPDQYVRYTL